jgi:glycosyltransferase involved in cell wall biosynthesis
MPKISIILPVFNVEKYIARSIQSVLDQTYPDFELLIVIDGSPDDSKQIAEKYASQDTRIKVFEKENGGLSDARNYGLERALGEFIYFMDSDDWIEPNLIEDNLKIVQEEKLNVVIFGYIQDDEDKNGNVTNSIVNQPTVERLYKDENIILDTHLVGILGYAWNKIYRHSFLKKNNLLFEKGTSLVEDILFNSQVYQNVEILRFNSNCYYHYLNRPVITLMKKHHDNSFELKVRKNEFLDAFFTNWKIKNSNEILADSLFLGIKYCVNNLYSYENGLSSKQRFEQLLNMADHPRTIKILKDYNPKSIKDRLFLFLLKNKCSRILEFLKKL